MTFAAALKDAIRRASTRETQKTMRRLRRLQRQVKALDVLHGGRVGPLRGRGPGTHQGKAQAEKEGRQLCHWRSSSTDGPPHTERPYARSSKKHAIPAAVTI